MCERHLVYLRVNNELYGKLEEEEIYFNKNVIGIHVQWLLGYSALNCLVNLLDFHQKNVIHHDGKNINLSPFSQMASDSIYRADGNRKYTNAEKVLQALYSICPITGFWETSAKILDKHNFFSNDNNTGITIIDLLEFDQPKYCFLNPGSWFVDAAIKTLPSCEPLDAITYLTGFGQPPQNWGVGSYNVSNLSWHRCSCRNIFRLTRHRRRINNSSWFAIRVYPTKIFYILNAPNNWHISGLY